MFLNLNHYNYYFHLILLIILITNIKKYFSFCRMDVTALPTWQDCHELWSKKRKRERRENQPKTNEAGEPVG